MIYYLPRAEELVDEIQRRIEESGGEFETIEEYIEFIITEFLKKDEPEQVYTPEEEEEMKKRLRRPGIHPVERSIALLEGAGIIIT